MIISLFSDIWNILHPVNKYYSHSTLRYLKYDWQDQRSSGESPLYFLVGPSYNHPTLILSEIPFRLFFWQDQRYELQVLLGGTFIYLMFIGKTPWDQFFVLSPHQPYYYYTCIWYIFHPLMIVDKNCWLYKLTVHSKLYTCVHSTVYSPVCNALSVSLDLGISPNVVHILWIHTHFHTLLAFGHKKLFVKHQNWKSTSGR